jgi:hypothetical protein
MKKKVNIFSPIYHRFEKTKRSIESIIESVDSSIHDVTLCLGVNGIEHQEMNNWLETLVVRKNIVVYNPNKNLGKAGVVNYMYKHHDDGDYVISVDSDMVAHQNNRYNWIDELVKLSECPGAKNFGLFSTYQDEANAHLLKAQTQKTEFLGHYIIFGAFYGVAGGCVILKNSLFKEIEMYTEYDVYSGDDAFLMKKINAKKKLIGITTTIRLLHQKNDEQEKAYQDWKIAKCHGRLPIGKNTKGFWD